MFFERGCLWRGPATDGAIITARFEPPLLGKPALIGRREDEAFLKLCAGVDATRPVDLVPCGHARDRVEYRVAWDREAQELCHFTDFYLENPATYYSYREAGVDGRVHLRIRADAAPDAPIAQARDALAFKARDIPPSRNRSMPPAPPATGGTDIAP